MKPIEFFRDGNGRPHARGSDTLLATFLVADCQSSVGVIDDLLSKLDSDSPSAEFTGNAHHVAIDGDRVGIEPLHSDAHEDGPTRFLSTVYFRQTVREWRAFVSAESPDAAHD